MSTFKEKLVSGVRVISSIPQKVTSWSQKTQIIVAAGTAGTLMIASVGGVAIYQHNTPEETVAEVDTDTEEVAMTTETDIPEVAVATEIVDIPTFVSCVVSGNSIEKDLTLYIKGSDKKKIEGEQFEIKLISPSDKSKLSDALAAIDDINEQIENINENGGEEENKTADEKKTSVTSNTGSGTLTLETGEDTDESTETGEEAVYISSLTGLEVTEEEELLCAKAQAIEDYAQVLQTLDGEVYTDTDSDGMIYIDSITDGDYIACLVPSENYDAQNYAVKVNVKEKIEYEAVENIEDKTVSEAKAGDVEETHEDIVVEETLTDTVEWVDSRVDTSAATYNPTTASLAAGSAGSASAEIVTSRTEKAPDEQETETTEAGTETEPGTETEAGTEVENGTETESKTSGAIATSARKTGKVIRTSEVSTQSQTSETGGVEYTDKTGTLKLEVSSTTLYQCKDSSLNQAMVTAACDAITDTSGTESGSVTISFGGNTVTGTSMTITAAEASSGKVTASVTDASGTVVTVSVPVTIVAGSTPLKDSAGHELYTDNKGTNAATVADYSEGTTFYYKSSEGSSTYYGWQTIGGSRYYFDKNGNKVTGTQVIAGNQYNFGADGVLLTSGYGIDVSKWQGSIDWKQASSAVSFAIIRAGFRGSNGGISVDSYAGTNIKNAKANGVKVGLYFYSRAVNEVQAVEEASVAISVAKQYGGISLPIYIDMEADNQKSLSTAQRDAIVLAFCATVKNAGYQAGVYANKNWLTNYLTPSSYSGYSIWCAQYNSSCTYGGRYDIWQYSSKGSIPGISGNVDLDQSFF
jgi:GH25 family lysozyme M1 (1,4-beta-N-acetylmuramidase)